MISEGKSGIQIILESYKYLNIYSKLCVSKCLPEQESQNMNAITA